MKKRQITCAALALLFGISAMMPAVAAPSIGEARNKKDELVDELDDVENQVAKLKEKSAGTQDYINKLDEQLAELSGKMVQYEQELSEKQTELEQTQAALEEAKAKKDKQYEDMKKRIKFMYENGDTAYLEMILNAEDFTDMLNKADYVKEISEYDRNMLGEFQNTVQDITNKEQQIEEEYAQIEALKNDVEAQKESVESVTAAKKQEMESYRKEIAASEELAKQYEDQIEAQEAEISRLEAEAARKAAEAAAKKKKEEEEAAKKAAEAKAAAAGSATATPNTSSKTETASDNGTSNTVSASGFVWPCPSSTRVTSEYGYRTHPITGVKNKMHNGIDVGAPSGTPIVAAAAGTVIAAAYNSSMGNYVMIDHGGGVTTVYMHCSGFATSSGTQVSAGQTIAYVGSTGSSTAPHLHFSVRENGSYVNPWNYLK